MSTWLYLSPRIATFGRFDAEWIGFWFIYILYIFISMHIYIYISMNTYIQCLNWDFSCVHVQTPKYDVCVHNIYLWVKTDFWILRCAFLLDFLCLFVNVKVRAGSNKTAFCNHCDSIYQHLDLHARNYALAFLQVSCHDLLGPKCQFLLLSFRFKHLIGQCKTQWLPHRALAISRH